MAKWMDVERIDFRFLEDLDIHLKCSETFSFRLEGKSEPVILWLIWRPDKNDFRKKTIRFNSNDSAKKPEFFLSIQCRQFKSNLVQQIDGRVRFTCVEIETFWNMDTCVIPVSPVATTIRSERDNTMNRPKTNASIPFSRQTRRFA